MGEKTKTELHFEAYQHYNTVLRAWFVVYGVAGPVLILGNEHLLVEFQQARAWGAALAILFGVGVFAQIVIAGLNKWIQWMCYYNTKGTTTGRWGWASRSSKKYEWDLRADLVTMITFFLATVIFVVMVLF